MVDQIHALGVSPTGGAEAVSGTGGVGATAPAAEAGFGEALDTALQGVNSTQIQAEDQLRQLANGTNADLHGTMIALEQANIALRAMVSVRDKVVEAYQSIWNMQV